MHAGPEDIARAVEEIRAGRLVAFPTETVYGLGADAMRADAVAAVFRAKGRPAANPLIVHVSDQAMARRVCAAWPPEASRLAGAFWPGPLTLVLPKAPEVPEIVTAGGPTVAVRCPSHPLTLALLETLGMPLVGPSANRSGHVSPTCAAHVRESFGEAEVFVLDGGPCAGGIESTVVDLTAEPARVLRPGIVTREDLERILGRPVLATQAPGETGSVAGPLRSPGQMHSHYAPRAPVILVEAGRLAETLGRLRGIAAVMAVSPGDAPPPHRHVAMPGSAREYAARLYAALREADALGPAAIVVVRPWDGPRPESLWAAIADRLERAAAPREGG